MQEKASHVDDRRLILVIEDEAIKSLRISEITQTLNNSENTVKHHLKSAFRKMRIAQRSKLINTLR